MTNKREKAKAITEASAILKAGGLVAFPTETVYGLGADANNETACRRIFAVKGRPLKNPLIVHLSSPDAISDWAREIPSITFDLAKAFWPGPLTLVLKKRSHVLDLVTGSQDTIALRIPNHPIAQNLLRAFGGGIAAPSANKFTYISATNANAIQKELGNEIDFIIDGGDSTLGLESTIIDISSNKPRLLRPGMISLAQLAELNLPVQFQKSLSEKNPIEASTIKVPGMYRRHYSPNTFTSLMETDGIRALLQSPALSPLPIAIMTYSMNPNISETPHLHHIKMPADPISYAHHLYRELRRLDHLRYQRIIIESVPADNAWDAIRDRLLKATIRDNFRDY